jgi:hypothetical protein
MPGRARLGRNEWCNPVLTFGDIPCFILAISEAEKELPTEFTKLAKFVTRTGGAN